MYIEHKDGKLAANEWHRFSVCERAKRSKYMFELKFDAGEAMDASLDEVNRWQPGDARRAGAWVMARNGAAGAEEPVTEPDSSEDEKEKEDVRPTTKNEAPRESAAGEDHRRALRGGRERRPPWTCTNCTYAENPAGKYSCKMCQGRRNVITMPAMPAMVQSRELDPRSPHFVPRNVREALSCVAADKWMESINSEKQSMIDNQVWELADLPFGAKLIRTHFIFKIKYGMNGEIEKYKSRLVAEGFRQVRDVHFGETFASVTTLASVRMMLAIATQLDMEVRHLDVKTAFLAAKLDFEIFIAQPEGMVDSEQRSKVARLLKSIYGLKQASRCWQIELRTGLAELGFKPLISDPSLYMLRRGKDVVIMPCCVDDLLMAHNNEALATEIVKKLQQRWDLKDLGKLEYTLGLKVTRTEGRTEVTQTAMIEDMLAIWEMEDAKERHTPAPSGLSLSKDDNAKDDEERAEVAAFGYRTFVGKTLWLARATRPDIYVVVALLAKYVIDPGRAHVRVAVHLMGYLKGTKMLGIVFTKRAEGDLNNMLMGYADASWADDMDERKSTSGFVFMLNGPVSWGTALQKIVAKSSTEAEYACLAFAFQELIWIRAMMQEMGFAQTGPTAVKEDNFSCITIAEGEAVKKATKHIALRFSFVRGHIQEGLVKMVWTRTTKMVADMLTKGVTKAVVDTLRGPLLGYAPLPEPDERPVAAAHASAKRTMRARQAIDEYALAAVNAWAPEWRTIKGAAAVMATTGCGGLRTNRESIEERSEAGATYMQALEWSDHWRRGVL
jgi:hypothetical protein